MESTAELNLGHVEEHPKAGILSEIRDRLTELGQLVEKHKGLLTQSQVAVVLGITRGRVNQLVKDGTFQEVVLRHSSGEVLGSFVAIGDVVAWLKLNPRSGTPGHRRALPMGEFLKAAWNIERPE